MRLWHYELLPYLPDRQFKGQLRELVAIMHDWRDKGKTNHLLINRVMDYDKGHLLDYFLRYACEYEQRFGRAISSKIFNEFFDFCNFDFAYKPVDRTFVGWHNKLYLRVCMANLYEKCVFGRGVSRIDEMEWALLCGGYEEITGEVYFI